MQQRCLVKQPFAERPAKKGKGGMAVKEDCNRLYYRPYQLRLQDARVVASLFLKAHAWRVSNDAAVLRQWL